MKKLLTLFAFLFAFGMTVNFSPGPEDTTDKETITWQVADMSTLAGAEILTVHYEPVFLDQHQTVELDVDQNYFMVYRASLTKNIESKDMLQTSISKNHEDVISQETAAKQIRSDKHHDPGSCGSTDKEA